MAPALATFRKRIGFLKIKSSFGRLHVKIYVNRAGRAWLETDSDFRHEKVKMNNRVTTIKRIMILQYISWLLLHIMTKFISSIQDGSLACFISQIQAGLTSSYRPLSFQYSNILIITWVVTTLFEIIRDYRKICRYVIFQDTIHSFDADFDSQGLE